MDRLFRRRTFGYPCTWRSDVPTHADPQLPALIRDAAWADADADPTVHSGTAGDDLLKAWLDDELESLEERFREFWTRRSLVVVLIAVCDP